MTSLAAVETPPLLEAQDFPPGIVIVPCHDLARYHHFSHDLTLLDVPDETVINFNRSASVVQNMNMGIEEMIRVDAAWAWLIGDDHVFPRDVIVKLLRHDVDIVVPLCAKRGPPFSLVCMNEELGADEQGRPLYRTMEYRELPDEDSGLFEVASAGTAGMLVKRHVFEELGSPWFSNSDGFTVNEDMEFCRRAREAGFKILVDPGTAIGHLGILAAWPAKVNGTWGVKLDLQQGAHVFFPGINPDGSVPKMMVKS